MNKIELRKFLKYMKIENHQKNLQEKYLLLALWDFINVNKPSCIGLFAAIENEVDLIPIFKMAQENGIATAYPSINGDEITFHSIESLQMLNEKAFGICAPAKTLPAIVPDLLIVPGLAFTKNGKRLGRGKGHYDRYLGQHKCKTVSLAFSWMLLDDLPTEPHDVRIDKVIDC
jgi:5-formyltetrahydrofolate cyclo-ligase